MNLSPLNQLRRSWRQNGDGSLCTVLLADCRAIYIYYIFYVHNYIDLLLCNETRIGGARKDGNLACYINIFKHERSRCFHTEPDPKKRRVDCPFAGLGYWIQWICCPKLKAIKQIRTREQARWDLYPNYLASNSYHGSAKWMKIGNFKMNFLYNQVIFQVDDQRKGSFTNLWHAGWTAVFNNIILRGSQKLTTGQRERICCGPVVMILFQIHWCIIIDM